jgi:hypothetical protein
MGIFMIIDLSNYRKNRNSRLIQENTPEEISVMQICEPHIHGQLLENPYLLDELQRITDIALQYLPLNRFELAILQLDIFNPDEESEIDEDYFLFSIKIPPDITEEEGSQIEDIISLVRPMLKSGHVDVETSVNMA